MSGALAQVADRGSVDIAKRASVRILEGLHRRGVGFGCPTRAVNCVIHNHQHATVDGLGAGSNFRRFVEIHRAIGAGRTTRTHGTDENNWLAGRENVIEEEAGFFHCVGAVRNDNAVDLVPVNGLFDADCELITGSEIPRGAGFRFR